MAKTLVLYATKITAPVIILLNRFCCINLCKIRLQYSTPMNVFITDPRPPIILIPPIPIMYLPNTVYFKIIWPTITIAIAGKAICDV